MPSLARQRIPFQNLNRTHQSIRQELLAAFERTLDSQQFIGGEELVRFEQEIAGYIGVPYAWGCGSGTDALLLALQAAGIGPGDEVLTTPFSFVATATAIARAGARPVFVDIEEAGFNLDPELLAGAWKRSPKVRAAIVVHLFGGCADMDPILELARSRDGVVIEDAAQAIGASYKGKQAMTMAPLGCLSFFPTKNLGGFGDGGLVTSLDKDYSDRLAALRVHGSRQRYYHDWIGLNSRLDAVQAALLRVKLGYLDEWTEQRRRTAQRYCEGLARLDGGPLRLPRPLAYQTRHIYNQFVVRATKRDQLQAWLAEQGITTEIYYPLSLHQQKCFQDLGYGAGSFPKSERAAAEVLALPVYPGLEPENLEFIIDQILAFYRN